MRVAEMLVLGLFGGASDPLAAFNAYVATLSPILWLKTNETSGTTAANSGSAGAALNGAWTPGSGPPVGAVGQTGLLGPNSSYLFNKVDSILVVPNTAAHNALATFTRIFVCNPTSTGEGTFGFLYCWGSTISFGGLGFNFANTLTSQVDTNTTNARSDTNEGLTLGANQIIFMTYDDAGDRKIRLYKYIAGTLTQFTYAVQTAGTGTLITTAGAFNIGNRSGLDGTFDGLIGPALEVPSVMTTLQMQTFGDLA